MTLTHPYPEGEGMLQEFDWAHRLIRRQLLDVQSMGRRLGKGDPASAEAAAVLWSLGSACRQLRRLLEGHLGQEERSWLGDLRGRVDERPLLIDRIDRERRRVQSRLRSVEALVSVANEGPAELDRLTTALDDLAAQIDALLRLEEVEVFPALPAMRDRRR